MPVISRFYGIVVFMNYNDHDPPHFHARYQEAEVLVEIGSRNVVGTLPPQAMRLLLEWADLRNEQLRANWVRAREHKHLLLVEPLP